jgi:hypothetical protein
MSAKNAAGTDLLILAPPNLTSKWNFTQTPDGGKPLSRVREVKQGFPDGKFQAIDDSVPPALVIGEVFAGSVPRQPPSLPTLRGTVVSMMETNNPDFGTYYAVFSGIYRAQPERIEGT